MADQASSTCHEMGDQTSNTGVQHTLGEPDNSLQRKRTMGGPVSFLHRLGKLCGGSCHFLEHKGGIQLAGFEQAGISAKRESGLEMPKQWTSLLQQGSASSQTVACLLLQSDCTKQQSPVI